MSILDIIKDQISKPDFFSGASFFNDLFKKIVLTTYDEQEKIMSFTVYLSSKYTKDDTSEYYYEYATLDDWFEVCESIEFDLLYNKILKYMNIDVTWRIEIDITDGEALVYSY